MFQHTWQSDQHHGHASGNDIEKRGLSPMLVCGDEMAKLQRDEIELWRGVTKKAGIEPE